MPRLQFNVREETALALKERAAMVGKSVSRFVAELVEKELDPHWPGRFDRLLSVAPDFLDIEGLDGSLPPGLPSDFDLL